MGVLISGQTVKAFEETIDCDGRLKLHINKPMKGWISKSSHVMRLTNPSCCETVDEAVTSDPGLPSFAL